MDRFLLARFPFLIAVSSDIRSALIRAGARPENVAVVLNGIDHRRFRRVDNIREGARRELGVAEGDIVVGGVGRLEAQKRFDMLIDAVAQLLPRHPRLRLIIAGDGSLRQALEAQARAVLPCSAYQFAGHHEDIIRLHHAFDLFVQSSDYEGTPNAVLEAMALETPIVATRAGGTTELIADSVRGLLVPCGDPTALAHAIERTVLNPEAARARAITARIGVERDLSFEARMRTVEAIYEAVAHARNHARGTRGILPCV